MARTTKQLSGGGKDKFLRALIATETDIAPAAAERLGDTMAAAIADIRVRREAWEPTANAPVAPPSASVKPAALTKPAPALAAPPSPQTEPAPVAAAFDPFVFSALAVLTKKGAGELSARLTEITSVADLHALALAQHLTVDTSLTDATALRSAIVSATEKRLAERRAAAS
jgi:hypothetical protein